MAMRLCIPGITVIALASDARAIAAWAEAGANPPSIKAMTTKSLVETRMTHLDMRSRVQDAVPALKAKVSRVCGTARERG